MRSAICRVLIALVVLDSGLCSNASDPPVTLHGSLTTVNDTTPLRSPLRTSAQRNRTIASQKSRGRQSGLMLRFPVQKKRQRQRVPSHLSDQGFADPLHSAVVNGSTDGGKDAPTESEVQLRRALRQKRRKLKRLWQEIERMQRALKSASGGAQSIVASGRQRNDGTVMEDGKGKPKTKNRKSHWRRRMMQRLKLLSRQLQEQQQRPLSTDTMEKLYALLTLESPSGGGKNSRRGSNIEDRNGRRQAERRSKNHRGQHYKHSNSTASTRAIETASAVVTVRPVLSNHRASDVGNRTMQQAQTGRQRLSIGDGSRSTGKTGGVFGGRTGVKKGEAGSVCASHKNCKPGFCCHQSTSLKTSSANTSNSICVEHRLKQGQPCANSCQCDNGLQCFISRKDKLHHKRLSPPDLSSSWSSSSQRDEGSSTIVMTAGTLPSSNDGQCKIPATHDVLHGTYIIGDLSVFKPKP